MRTLARAGVSAVPNDIDGRPYFFTREEKHEFLTPKSRDDSVTGVCLGAIPRQELTPEKFEPDECVRAQ